MYHYILDRLSDIVEGRKASKLASKISQVVEDFCVEHDLPTMQANNRKRRGQEDNNGEKGSILNNIFSNDQNF